MNAEKRCFEHYKECPVCTGSHIKDKYVLDQYTLAECPDCTGVFVKEIVTKDFLHTHYQEPVEAEYVYEDNNEKVLNYYYNRIKSEIEKIKPGKGAILDVGCSSGAFLRLMHGWDRYGTEISGKFGNIARTAVGDTVHIGPFEDYPVKKDYFDVITMQDVFDHFIDPRENLKKCFEMLKPGGLLVIKVHNISCLYAKIAGPNYNAIIPPDHLFYFNRNSLKVLLNRVGLRVLKTKYIGHLMQLKTVFYRLSRDGANTGFFYKTYKFLKNNMLGRIIVYKNVRDIITVFAVKDR